MRHFPLVAALLLVLCLSPALEAQTKPQADSSRSGQATALPFPTRLRVALKTPEVTLTWEDSPEAKYGYALYRSTEAFSVDNALKARRIADIKKGEQRYVDRPTESASYYYALFALSEKGEPLVSVNPTKNVTSAPVEVLLASIRNFSVKVEADAIVLGFDVDPNVGRLALYRGTAAFVGASSLLDAVLVASFVDKSGRFVDYPVPGIDYWYALIREEDLKAGKIAFSAGSNTNAAPARIAEGLYRIGLPETPHYSRTPPLPSFLLDRAVGIESYPEGIAPAQGPGKQKSLSASTMKAIAAILQSRPAWTPPMPKLKLLAPELGDPSGGEEYALALIVKERVQSGQNDAAVEELKKYLSLNRSIKTAARARYYLGIALARSGDYREAFFEFLRARDELPVETGPWIDFLISSLAKTP